VVKIRVSGSSDRFVLRVTRATANRTLTTLKASLNHIYYEGRAANDEAWRKVKPFREADAPIVHFLRLAEPLLIMAALLQLRSSEGNLTRSRYHRLSVIQRFNILCDRSMSLRGTPLRRNSLILAITSPRKAAELGKKAPLATGERSPEAVS
jgi:hypothetical protein